MKNQRQEPQRPDERQNSAAAAPEKAPWHEPKLTFVEPELKKQGDMTKLTGQGFFGTVVP
jgi:hypothetical protein